MKCVLFLFFITIAFSQKKFGKIEGYISDSKGNPIESANIYINNSTIGVYSSSTGYFYLNGITLGQRTLIVDHQSYKKELISILFLNRF